MIYILGGAPRSGKTLLSERMLHEKRIPFLSADVLKSGIARGLPDFGLDPHAGALSVHLKLWPILDGIITTLINIESNYLIEGDCILPQPVTHLMELHPGQIKACFMGYTEMEVSEKVHNIKKYAGGTNDWLSSYDEDVIVHNVEGFMEFSQFLKEQCEVHKLNYFETAVSFEEAADAAMEYFLSE